MKLGSCVSTLLVLAITSATSISGLSAADDSILPDDLSSYNEKIVSFGPTFIPTVLPSVNISQQCFKDSLDYFTAFMSQRNIKWAKLMYLSTAKLTNGVTHTLMSTLSTKDQSYFEMGLFDQCLAVRAVTDTTEFRGKYCSVYFQVKPIGLLQATASLTADEIRVEDVPRPASTYDPIRLHNAGLFGFCIPSSCSAQDLRSALANQLGTNGSTSIHSILISTDDNHCHTDTKERSMDAPSIIMIGILCLLILLVLMATIQEAIKLNIRYAGYRASRLLHSFSAISNCRTLLSTRVDSQNNLSCLHGIKVLTALWIILHHLSNEILHRNIYNKGTLVEEAYQLGNQFIVNGFVTVDTFFLISGLLVAYSLLRELDQNGQFNIFSFYLHRFIRLTPAYAAIFGFIATIAVHLGSGPDWNYMEYISEDCRSTWWQNALYINNYFQTTFCMTEAWYVACDMQMFWLSPLFIYPLWRWRKAGLVYVASVIAAFIGINIGAHVIWNLPPTIMPTRPAMMKDIVEVYGKMNYSQVYTRIPPYLLGILLGWIIHITKNKNFNINRKWSYFGWTFSTLTCFLIIFGLFPYLREDLVPEINHFLRVIYGSFHHLGWATAIAWIIFACVHGYGGVVNRVLSWNAFMPLGRLTYTVYLIHFNLIKMHFSRARQPIYVDKLDIFVMYLGIVIASFTLSSFVSLIVEIPFINLDRMLLTKTQVVVSYNYRCSENMGNNEHGMNTYISENLKPENNIQKNEMKTETTTSS